MSKRILSPLTITFKLIILLTAFVSCSSKDEIKPTDISGKWINTVQVYETWMDSIKTSTETIPNDQDNYIKMTFDHNGTFHSELMDSGSFKEACGQYEITNDTLTITGTINAEPFIQKHKLNFSKVGGMKMVSEKANITSGGKKIIYKATIDYIRE